MRTIGHEELKQKLDRQDDFRLVMALAEWAYQAKHIPGSIHFATMREALHSLNKEDEIVPMPTASPVKPSANSLSATAIRMSCTLPVVSRSGSRRAIP
jgi:hypothetical protein